jgi:hypothetical protein
MAPSFMFANFVLASAKIRTFFYSANFLLKIFNLFYLSPTRTHIKYLQITLLRTARVTQMGYAHG